MDYALHPLLAAKGTGQVVRGEFVLDQKVGTPGAAVAVEAAAVRFTSALAPRLRKVSRGARCR